MFWLPEPASSQWPDKKRSLSRIEVSGRYKAPLVEAGTGYFKTVCDYVHLNPVRAGLLKVEDSLAAYPWRSLSWYAAAREHRPSWVWVDRLLRAHGTPQDRPAGRAEFPTPDGSASSGGNRRE